MCINKGKINFIQSVYSLKITDRIKGGMKRKIRKYPENNLRALREAKGLTLEELAARTDPPMSHGMIQFLEQGDREFRLKWKERLAPALECQITDFLIKGESPLFDNEKSQDYSELKIAREQINSAIELWLQDSADSVINALAISAYKIVQQINAKRVGNNVQTAIINKKLGFEQLIFGSIVGLLLYGESLASNERIFYRWYHVQNPKLFPENDRAMFMQFTPIGENIRKMDKRRFWHSFSGDNS